jgi:SsrA-binding protein
VAEKDERKFVARNKKARHDYFIEETFEAGVALRGSEVKSLREGRGNLTDSFAEVRSGELFLVGSHVSEYPFANQFNHPPRRERKLLLHRREIDKLEVKVEQRGYTLIPLSLYLKKGRIKVELGLGRGKKQYDKRATERKREQDREVRAAVGRARRS